MELIQNHLKVQNPRDKNGSEELKPEAKSSAVWNSYQDPSQEYFRKGVNNIFKERQQNVRFMSFWRLGLQMGDVSPAALQTRCVKESIYISKDAACCAAGPQAAVRRSV